MSKLHNQPGAFKKYYANQEFREKHLNYVKERIECPHGCGVCPSRANLSRHVKSAKCIKYREDQELRKKIRRIEKILAKQ